MGPVAHVFTHTTGIYVSTSSGVGSLPATIDELGLRNRWKPAPAQAEFNLHLNEQLRDILGRSNQGQTALKESSPIDTVFLDSHLQRLSTLAEARVLVDVNVKEHMLTFPLARNGNQRAGVTRTTTRIVQVRFKPKQLSPFWPLVA